MIVTKSYKFEKTLGKKDFLLKIVERLKEEKLPYDIFSLDFSEVKEETRTAFLVSGSGELDYSCSVGDDEYDYSTGNRILRYRPLSGKVTGSASGLVCCYAPIELAKRGELLKKTKTMSPVEISYEMTGSELENCKENISSIIFDKYFVNPGAYVKGLSFSGRTVIEDVKLIEVPYYSCSFFYKEHEVKIVGIALEDFSISIIDLNKIPKLSPEEEKLPSICEKEAEAPKWLIYFGIFPAGLMFVCFYMFIQNLGRNIPSTYFFLFWCIAGLFGTASIGYIMKDRKKRAYKKMEERRAEFEKTREKLLNELVEKINSD